MRYIAFFAVFLLLLFTINSSALAAQQIALSSVTPTPPIEYGLPYPGILPDHPLYVLKAARDKILLFFTRDEVKRVNLNLLFADKRLVMGQLLWEKGNADLSLTTLTKAEKYLLSVSVGLNLLKKHNNLPPGLADKTELATKKHEEIILKMVANVDDEMKKQNLNQALGINHQAMQQILSLK